MHPNNIYLIEPCQTSTYPISRRKVLSYLGIGMISPGLLASCGGNSSTAGSATSNSEQLKLVLSQSWEQRYGGYAGGLTMQVISPQGDYFANTVAGTTSNSHFRGASITKTFTAAGIMLLDQRGQLRITDYLSDPIPGGIGSYLPAGSAFDIPNKSQITLFQLLNHSAGVFDLTNQVVPLHVPQPYAGMYYLDWQHEQDPYHSFTKDEIISVVAVNGLSYAIPGVSWHYSDTHYAILGKIIEVVSGMSLNDFISLEFLIPNQLDQTSFVINGSNWSLPSPYITGHSLSSNVLSVVTEYNYSYDPGSGNLITTTANLVAWIRKLLKGEAGVSSAQIARMCTITPPSTFYGLGLAHNTSNGVQLGWGHNGGCGGYLTDAYHDPITDVSYVLQSSLIQFDDLLGEMSWLTQTALDARRAITY